MRVQRRQQDGSICLGHKTLASGSGHYAHVRVSRTGSAHVPCGVAGYRLDSFRSEERNGFRRWIRRKGRGENVASHDDRTRRMLLDRRHAASSAAALPSQSEMTPIRCMGYSRLRMRRLVHARFSQWPAKDW